MKLYEYKTPEILSQLYSVNKLWDFNIVGQEIWLNIYRNGDSLYWVSDNSKLTKYLFLDNKTSLKTDTVALTMYVGADLEKSYWNEQSSATDITLCQKSQKPVLNRTFRSTLYNDNNDNYFNVGCNNQPSITLSSNNNERDAAYEYADPSKTTEHQYRVRLGSYLEFEPNNSGYFTIKYSRKRKREEKKKKEKEIERQGKKKYKRSTQQLNGGMMKTTADKMHSGMTLNAPFYGSPFWEDPGEAVPSALVLSALPARP
ncbi:hypothetical protein HELRODRAFT_182574 [Helobdella robusta]|uniref:Uncharacterized protein n=1 Tax=Helobdella robusta TaxID=6412 RepID=T1FID8_HELRO|nr:hypothetical protein HELRODRAFT_182574 [Helobdella robusta]ESN90866.1 hypothetical protein HELRODRAFT_182574 [Helobdella robusta]